VAAVALLALPGAGWSSGRETQTCFFPATIVGTAGDDHIEGTSGDDVIVGLDGNDTINGSGGNDIICGSNGDDLITTRHPEEGGLVTIHGDSGNDTIRASAGRFTTQQFSGGLGDDRNQASGGITNAISFTDSPRPVTVNLTGKGVGEGRDTLSGRFDSQRLRLRRHTIIGNSRQMPC
jgi:Ca2+-binding RTX toxin-like protein